ncbi:rap guanine nucleotide exchange factor 3-like, partial [Mustelus asterias]
MNLLRTQHYDFQIESQHGKLIQGICWKPIEEVAMSEPSEGVRRCPCERLPQAARTLQKAVLSASPNLLRDRKHFMRTVRKCCTGKELVDSVMKLNPALQTRPQAVGVLQLLVDEAVLFNVRPEWSFQDKDNHFYQFSPEEAIVRDRHSEEDLLEAMNLLSLLGPDALLTASLRKPPSQRTAEDLETIYEELLHIKAVSHLSSTVKRQLAAVLHFESHRRAGTV